MTKIKDRLKKVERRVEVLPGLYIGHIVVHHPLKRTLRSSLICLDYFYLSLINITDFKCSPNDSANHDDRFIWDRINYLISFKVRHLVPNSYQLFTLSSTPEIWDKFSKLAVKQPLDFLRIEIFKKRVQYKHLISQESGKNSTNTKILTYEYSLNKEFEYIPIRFILYIYCSLVKFLL